MLTFIIAVLGGLASVVGALLLFKHCADALLLARDAEWQDWAMDHGIKDGFPGYGYERKNGEDG